MATVSLSAATGLSIPGDPASLTTKQLDVERARDRILAFVAEFVGPIARAIDHLNAERFAGRLPSTLAWAYDNAWDKPRSNNRLNLKTYHNWSKLKKTCGRVAPRKVQPDMEIKPWYGLLLALKKRPQGSCYTWIHEQIASQWDRAWGDEPPSYDAIRRVCVDKLSAIDQLKGRYTGSALRSHRHYKTRTADGMVPWQEVHADGWNTHFTAPHPATGEFVTYEVWHFHDVATKFVPPPGIGLTETYEVITAGLERCVRVGGMMAVLQTDSTKVIKRSPRFTADPFAALSERAGFTVVHPVEVGNSQANGIPENFNTYLDRCSRELATYQGKGMDSLTLKRVKKLTEKMVKATNAGDLIARDEFRREAEKAGKGRVFISVEEAEDWINAACDKHNDKPHSQLPRIADPVTGRKRHQTPREALMQHLAEGWRPVALAEEHLIDLFRPHVRCTVRREAVSPVGNKQRYYHPELGAWNDQEVMVAIDPMEWRTVLIKQLNGEIICAADLVSASGYRAKSQYEIAESKRAQAQMKRLSKKADTIMARTRTPAIAQPAPHIVIAGRVFDATALQKVESAQMPEAARQGSAQIQAPQTSDADSPAMAAPIARSARTASENFTAWQQIDAAVLAGHAVSEDDARWHQTYQRSAQFRAEAAKRKAAA